MWIFGGVERTEERKLFLVEVPDRTKETLLANIQRHVKPGSIIYSDLWRSYSSIERDIGLQHYTVNHSINFVDSETGVHTNTIEGTWSGVKKRIPVRNRIKSRIDSHLLEFIWRRTNNENLFVAFFNALRDIYFD